MGSCCSCLKNHALDDKQLELPFQRNLDPNFLSLDNSIDKFSGFITHDIIRLQGLLRGFIDRRRTHSIYHSLNNNFNIPPSNSRQTQLQELSPSDLPEFFTRFLQKAEQNFGRFTYPASPLTDIIKRSHIELEDGSIYLGGWNSSNERQGRGCQVWKDGRIYEGVWQGDRPCGYGRQVDANGDMYIGSWVDGKKTGTGQYLHTGGAKYCGEWKEDKHEGRGTESWPDGARYEGGYLDGKKHGYGVFVWGDQSRYEGEFMENSIHGVGKYHWSDGRVYVGDWKNNKMEGKGNFTWSDGRRYFGDYWNDKKHGHGIFEWTDNRKYEGTWVDGKQHGRGVYTTAEGTFEGEWRHGKRIKLNHI